MEAKRRTKLVEEIYDAFHASIDRLDPFTLSPVLLDVVELVEGRIVDGRRARHARRVGRKRRRLAR